MKKVLLALALIAAPMSAQANLTGGYEFTGAANTNYRVTYLGSGGASYWHSLWAVPSVGTPELLFCKVAGCVSNTFYGQAQTPVVYGGTSPWTFGLFVNTSGTPNLNSGYWLYSVASMNYGTSYLREFVGTGVTQDDRSTVIPGTLNQLVYGFEDVTRGGDWDFNDAVFAFEDAGPRLDGEVVPEPASMTLLATGLLGMVAARRKKRSI